MARKAKTVWEVSKETLMTVPVGTGENYIGIDTYALRTDGVLITKYATRTLDGKAKHNYGWKIKTRTPRHNLLESLLARGYVR